MAADVEHGTTFTVVPVRRYGQIVLAGVVALLVAWLAAAGASSHFINPAVVGQYLLNPLILGGLANTIFVSIAAMLIGIVLGVFFAVMKMSSNTVLAAVSGFYIWFFRGTPVLVQLIFWFNGVPAVFHDLALGIPFTDVIFFSMPMVAFMTPLAASLLGLGLNEGAYMAEIVRGGILAVDEGQVEAAQALGMVSAQTMRRIILPQAMRVIIPPIGNEFISMLKTSSLASVVTFGELLRRASDIYSSNLFVVELLVVASLWYLLLTTVASIGQYYVEKRFARGTARAERETPWQAVLRNLMKLRR
ncbi:amino acid ABC transporter permease [bacterium]|nr:MAG: amino acid ABC transporter permease [bacterium]